MKLIVLCGGQGSRLKTVVKTVPKPLAPVGDTPFLEILLDKFVSEGFSDIVLSAGYMSEKIETFIKNYNKCNSLEVLTEDEPLGTGGAVKLFCELHADPQKVLVANGDTFIPELPHLSFFQKTADQTKFAIFGRTGISDDNGRYSSFRINAASELVVGGKDSKRFVSSGIYLIDTQSFLYYAEKHKKVGIDDILLEVIESGGSVIGQELNSPFIDIGMPDDYEKFKVFHDKSLH
jgi:NDP-sugar pyrophosphorylase family protein